jgi:hypothetical protein
MVAEKLVHFAEAALGPALEVVGRSHAELPWVHRVDGAGFEVGGVAGGEGEVVDFGGGGDEGVGKGCAMRGAVIGCLFADDPIHVEHTESSGVVEDIAIPVGENGGEGGILALLARLAGMASAICFAPAALTPIPSGPS